MNTDQNVEFLNEIYQNAKMTINALDILEQKTQDQQMKSDLKVQSAGYHQLATQAATELSLRGKLPNDTSVFQKAGMWSGIQLNTLTGACKSKVAEMIINGSMMGIIDTTRSLNGHPNLEQPVLSLGQQLIQTEQNNIEAIRKHL